MQRRNPTISRLATLTAAAGLAVAAMIPGSWAAAADTTATSGAMSLMVSPSSDAVTDGAVVTVSGSGFDITKGIYVAVCVDTGPGNTPTPCLGGVDMTGSAGGSAWISSNPPPYGEGLAIPYNPDGSFTLTMTLSAGDPINGVDCRQVSCALLTRADHTRSSDRSMDVRIPLTFVEAGAAVAPTEPPVVEQSPAVEQIPSVEQGSAVDPIPASTGSTPLSAPMSITTSTSSSASEPTATSATTSPSTSAATPTDIPESTTTAAVTLAGETTDNTSSTAWIWWLIGAVVVIGGLTVVLRRRRTAS